MAYFNFEMTYQELSLSTQVCYAIIENISDQYLVYDHFIDHEHIKIVLKFLNEELRSNENEDIAVAGIRIFILS